MIVMIIIRLFRKKDKPVNPLVEYNPPQNINPALFGAILNEKDKLLLTEELNKLNFTLGSLKVV